MEKRFYLGIGLLALFLALGILSSVAIDKVSEPVSQDLELASREALSGDLEGSIQTARQAKEDWEASWQKVAMVADHGPMDEIDSLFAQMEVYADARDRLHFGSYCARLSELIEAVADAQRFTWWNLL